MTETGQAAGTSDCSKCPRTGLSALGTTEVITGVRQEDMHCAPETCLLPRPEPGPDAEQIVTAVCASGTRMYADSGVQTAAAAGWCGQSLRWGHRRHHSFTDAQPSGGCSVHGSLLACYFRCYVTQTKVTYLFLGPSNEEF